MRIPVVFATDKNYIFYTCVAITSLAKYAASDTEYNIYILIDEGDMDNLLLNKVDKRYSNIHIQMIQIDKEIFKNVIINNRHITKATFYRLVLSQLLNVDKCIYLDSDILVTDDLQDLFSVDMDEYYIAGCRDIWIDMISEEEREERRKRTGQIPSLKEYINAGVMVMNLRKIEEDKLDHIFMRHLEQNYLFEDQDIINICCYGKIKHLPARWNIFTVFLGELTLLRQSGISENVLIEYKEKKGILHYATLPVRPWKHPFCFAGSEWWNIASEWKEEKVYQEMKAGIEEKVEKGQWSYYMRRCRKYQKIAIFGFTYYGRMFCDWLLNNGFKSKLVICDNDPKKKGQIYKGIHVIALGEVGKGGTLFINCSQRRSDEVTEMLLQSSIDRENILVYIHSKKIECYTYLDEKYYLNELKDIFYRERGSEMYGFQDDLYVMQRELLQNSEYQNWHDRYQMKNWILKGK